VPWAGKSVRSTCPPKLEARRAKAEACPPFQDDAADGWRARREMRLLATLAVLVIPSVCGGSSTPRLLGSITGASGILDHPRARMMTAEDVARDTASRSRRMFCARLTLNFSPSEDQRARGMVLRLIRDLPGDRALLPPSLSRNCVPRELSASVGAPGPHDFAVRVRLARQARRPRPPHPAPRP
jgi:hypothetical protein